MSERAARAPARRRTVGARYVITIAILAVTAVAMLTAESRLEAFLQKYPIPVREPLGYLQISKLGENYRPAAQQPPRLSHEVEVSLGASDYAQWRIEDMRKAPSDPTRIATVFVSYFTGDPDQVPHVPDECMAASGYKLQEETEATISIPNADGSEQDVRIRLLRFGIPPKRSLLETGAAPSIWVAYFFHANGKFRHSRMGVRLAQANLWDKYAYYAKVELSFSDAAGRTLANREQTLRAAEDLLSVLMPVMLDEHFPDWDNLPDESPSDEG